MTTVLSFALISLLFLTNASATQKKRIAILDFSANNTSPAYAKIVRNAFEVSLYKTGAFDILERNKIDLILKEQGFHMSGCTDTSCAVHIGKLLSTDLVVIGSLDKFGSFIVTAKMVDITKGNVLFADNARSADANGIQKAVDALAKRSARKVIGRNRIVVDYTNDDDSGSGFLSRIFSNIHFWLFADGYFSISNGDFADLVKPGYGGIAEVALENLFLNKLFVGIESGYIYHSGKEKNTESLTMIPVLGTLKYKIPLSENIYIAPAIAAGISYNTLSYDRDGIWREDSINYENESARELMAKGGIRFGLFFNKSYELHIASEYGSIFEKSGRLDFFGIRAGAGMKF